MKSKLLMILFVLILGSVLTGALVSVDKLTAPYIAKNKVKKLREGILKAFGIAHTKDSVEEVFTENVEETQLKTMRFYREQKSGNISFEFHGPGLWGPIEGTIALSPDLKVIKGISIIHQEETPGLGGRIAELVFLNQFTGKNVTGDLIIQSPGKASGDSEVDGITGATLSCKAFEAILNSEIKKYVSIIKEAE